MNNYCVGCRGVCSIVPSLVCARLCFAVHISFQLLWCQCVSGCDVIPECRCGSIFNDESLLWQRLMKMLAVDIEFMAVNSIKMKSL